jgi:tetratricopeptide (TPR) repeat protein
MSYSEEKFRDHIRKMVQKTQVDSDRPLTLAELKELALDMGMVDSEWDALLLKAEEHLELAKKHLAVKNFMNAVDSAEEATSINPYIKDGNAVKAQAYYQLSILEKNENHLVKAGEYARRELILDPLDATALHVLSAVENQNSEGRYSKKLFKYLGIGGAIVLVLFLAISFCTRQATYQDASDSISNGAIGKNRSVNLVNSVEEKERLFKEAVQRRNDFLLAWYSQQGNSAAIENMEDYDFDDLSKSESNLKKGLGAARAKNDFSSEERVQLEGLENRMAVAKKRWFESITAYNSYLQDYPKETKKLDKIDFPE